MSLVDSGSDSDLTANRSLALTCVTPAIDKVISNATKDVTKKLFDFFTMSSVSIALMSSQSNHTGYYPCKTKILYLGTGYVGVGCISDNSVILWL